MQGTMFESVLGISRRRQQSITPNDLKFEGGPLPQEVASPHYSLLLTMKFWPYGIVSIGL